MNYTEKLAPSVEAILTSKIAREYGHHYFYQVAGNWCQLEGFEKAAEYFLKESLEELEHAKKIQKYIVDWNCNPNITILMPEKSEFSSLLELIQDAYNTEYELYEIYKKDSVDIFNTGDICSFDFLQFFREAQKDAVITYSNMLSLLDGVDSNNKFNLLMLEEKLF
jgi:ferritin